MASAMISISEEELAQQKAIYDGIQEKNAEQIQQQDKEMVNEYFDNLENDKWSCKLAKAQEDAFDQFVVKNSKQREEKQPQNKPKKREQKVAIKAEKYSVKSNSDQD